MKKQIIAMLVSAVAVAAFAQETNKPGPYPEDGPPPAMKNRDRAERPEMTPEQIEKREQRNVQLMERVLTKIGVGDEDKEKIRVLQKEHRAKMESNLERTKAAREKLSRLQDEGAAEADIYAAVDEVASAQAEQLRILVRNRMEMEQILGKEKYAKFMESARMQFRKHDGRRGDAGMPPRPGLPPIPEQGPGGSEPPDPPLGLEP